MKRILIVIGTAIVIAGVSAYGYSSLLEEGNTSNTHQIKTTSANSIYGLTALGIFNPLNEDLSADRELEYAVWARYTRPITKEELNNATSLGDVIQNFPVNWISEYESVEIVTSSNGIEKKAAGSNEYLTSEQTDLIRSAQTGTDITIDVRYKSKSTATNKIENHVMNVKYTIVPEVEAEFNGGYDQMISYLNRNSKAKIEKMDLDLVEPASVFFTVNEQGQTENIQLRRTFGDAGIDKLLVELIKDMPKWNPAENADGLATKQDFELFFGKPGC